MSKQEHKVETTLSPELHEKFQKVKNYFGVHRNSNVIRVLIVEKYGSIAKEGWG